MPNTSCFPVAAPDVELIDLAGNPWRLWDALKSGSVLLAFIKTSCPTCAFTLPFLQRLHEQASPASPAILAVSQDDAATTSKYLQHFGIRLPAAIDKAWDFAAGTAFGIHLPRGRRFLQSRPRNPRSPRRRFTLPARRNGPRISPRLKLQKLTPVGVQSPPQFVR